MFRWSFSQARQVLSAPMWSSSEPLPSADRDRGPGALPAISLPAKWLSALSSHLGQQQPLGRGIYAHLASYACPTGGPREDPQSRELTSPKQADSFLQTAHGHYHIPRHPPLGLFCTVERLTPGPSCQGTLRLIRETDRDINITRSSWHYINITCFVRDALEPSRVQIHL